MLSVHPIRRLSDLEGLDATTPTVLDGQQSNTSVRYPGGYVLHVSGPAVVTSTPGASIVTLRNTGAGIVTVQVARS